MKSKSMDFPMFALVTSAGLGFLIYAYSCLGAAPFLEENLEENLKL